MSRQDGEFAFIDRLRRLLPAPPEGQTWIGDDAAELEGGVLFALDVLVEGVHVDFGWSTPEDAGWKALAVNVSDIAAMGGRPWAAVVGLVVPQDREGMADRVGEGLAAAATELGCPVVGGDTSNGPVCMIAVAILGRAEAPGAVRRSGARPGDAVFVTGPLGGPAAALRSVASGGVPDGRELARLRRPESRVAHGLAAVAARATAMIDVSDGLVPDLGHLCDGSNTGVVLDAAAVPLGGGAQLDDALGGGDDYELIFCAPDPAYAAAVFADRGLPPPIRIGTMTEDQRRVVLRDDGTTEPLPAVGWQHHVPRPST